MKDYIQKTKDWVEKIKIGKTSYEKKGSRPSRDWKIILSSTFIAFVLLALLASYFYLKVESGEIFTVTKESLVRESEINKVLLKKVVTNIDEREDFVRELKRDGLVPNDPSI